MSRLYVEIDTKGRFRRSGGFIDAIEGVCARFGFKMLSAVPTRDVAAEDLPQNHFERLPGESEVDFSLRMAQLQAKRLADRRGVEATTPVEKKRIW